MDAAYTLADRACLIHPARFLSNAGSTPKEWNQKMLDDPHFTVLNFEAKSATFFPGTDIKGGIAITYRDATRNFGAIGTFTPFPELNRIYKKVTQCNGSSLMSQIFQQNKYLLDVVANEYPNMGTFISGDGKDRRLRNNAFTRVPFFTETPTKESDIKIFGLIGNKRVHRYMPVRFLDTKHPVLEKWKVFVPTSNGTGALGEVLSTPLIGQPLIGQPLIGHTQSFISIGCFDTQAEAEACLKYVKSKFARTLLGVLKTTQHNPPAKWKYVPLQDFTGESDIDWSVSVAEVDQQLYKKYGLSEEEIDFIESKVRAMD